jgi:RND family efflux transporter MFP subunit
MAAALGGCAEKEMGGRVRDAVPVRVVEAAAQAVTGERSFPGMVGEAFSVTVGFPGMGTVEEVFVDEGDRVRKGQLMATLGAAAARNSLDAAAAALRQAEDAYGRIHKLHLRGSVADIRLVEVEAALDRARAAAADAQRNLDDCRLVAPCDALAAVRSVEPGMTVMPGVAAFRLVAAGAVDIKIAVPENEIAGVYEGEEASIEIGGRLLAKGRVAVKGVTSNPLSHAYEVKIALDDKADARLLPGMVCRAHLAAHNGQPEIALPNTAIRVDADNRRFVWVVRDGIAGRRYVETGGLVDGGIVVSGGLEAGDMVVVEGYTKISEGMAVAVGN